MAYQVYLVDPYDGDNWVELDCEQVDFSTSFAVGDLSDISKRKDTITKHINFKGTGVNNNAFGNLYHLNRISDFALGNRLFFNYSPLRKVDCLIYEDSVLLLRGTMRVTEIQVDKNQNITYQTVITGSFIEFREVISQSYMDALDLSDLKHEFTWNAIKDSWEVRTQRWNAATSGYTYSPFVKGSGYVYGFMDYGHTFKQLEANSDINRIHISNFRPAIYAKEYFDRIFKQPSLSGYTYEIAGSADLTDRFNSLVIPNNAENVANQTTTVSVSATTTGTQSQNVGQSQYGATGDKTYMSRALLLQDLDTTGSPLISYYGSFNGEANTTFIINRTFTTGGYMKVKMSSFTNTFGTPVKLSLQLCSRGFISSSDPEFSNPGEWSIVASKDINVPANSGLASNTTLEMEIPEREFKENELLYLRIEVIGDAMTFEQILGVKVFYTLSESHFRLPKQAGSMLSFLTQYGDAVVPVAAQGVKQMDFIKSVMGMFNLYVYAEKSKSKHLIFKTYNDFYAYASPLNLSTNAVDWTFKLDRSASIRVRPNVHLPTKYLFTYKEDQDFMNKTYKTNWSQVYGTFEFNDAYGLSDQKKVELIFSPTPLVQYLGTKRVHPAIYQVDATSRKPIKSNIRILFYNGLKACSTYSVTKDAVVSGSLSTADIVSGVTTYAQVGNYWYQPGLFNMTPVEDLHFGTPKQVYFDMVPEVNTCPTAYDLYYITQTTDLTNLNVVYADVEVRLNEMDITNLDLRTPVFIDMGDIGHSYWKILEVQYDNNKTTSKVSLQKIAMP
ncbi:hypothetical protein [Flaviaesturariibacter amylovorans]|uniref:Uncharacterized protein n=1 Tax=Flaviaesturariibacter amylovorans TaxID=1084520 RepID=A0ABP8GL28_9BACT